jgi:polyisoprenoid-binding protein YceI
VGIALAVSGVPSRRGAIWCALRRALILSAALTICALAPALRAQESEFVPDPASTTVEFTLGASLHTVHGSFKLKNGTIHFDPAKGTASGQIVVDATSGESGNDGRDKKMHNEILESPKFSEVVFVPTRMQGTISAQGTSHVAVTGLLKMHGQDHEVTLDFAVMSDASGRTQAAAHFLIPYLKWGQKNPSTFILHVSDTVDIDIRAVGQLTSVSPRR